MIDYSQKGLQKQLKSIVVNKNCDIFLNKPLTKTSIGFFIEI